jgi:predicted RNA-binding protein (virulence factor B family)
VRKSETGKSRRTGVIKKGADKSGGIVAPRRSDEPSDAGTLEFREGQSVELLIGSPTEIGYTALIDRSREGLLYKSEVFQNLRKGQRIAGFIKKVRDDGKIDLCLQRPGRETVDEVSGRILDALKAHGGFMAVTDKSAPGIIYSMFGASKKTYKKAIGALYKKRLILIERAGIRLAPGKVAGNDVTV